MAPANGGPLSLVSAYVGLRPRQGQLPREASGLAPARRSILVDAPTDLRSPIYRAAAGVSQPTATG